LKKLILLGLILAGLFARNPVGWCAAYPTGQATVSLVTPFNYIAKYSGIGQTYLNEWVNRAAWGIPLDATSFASRATIGGINSTSGNVATKAVTLVVGKSAGASLAAVAVQAGLMVGAVYFGEWLEQETLEWMTEPPQVVDPTNVELPPEIPPGTLYWWDGTSGMGVGSTHCGPPQLTNTYQVKGFYTSYSAAQSACTAAKGSECGYGNLSNYNYCGGSWSGWSCMTYNTGYGTPYSDYVYTTDPNKHPHIVSTSELGTPQPLTAEEMKDRIEAAFNSGVPAKQQNAMEMAQGGLAAVAPYINEANKDFPTNHNTAPSGSPAAAGSSPAAAGTTITPPTAAELAAVAMTSAEIAGHKKKEDIEAYIDGINKGLTPPEKPASLKGAIDIENEGWVRYTIALITHNKMADKPFSLSVKQQQIAKNYEQALATTANKSDIESIIQNTIIIAQTPKPKSGKGGKNKN